MEWIFLDSTDEKAKSAHYTFPKCYVMINSLDTFGYKTDIFHISCTIALFFFISVALELRVHGYFVLVFIPKILVSVITTYMTTSAPAIF